MTDEMSKAVSLETAVEMFRAFKEADTLEKTGLVWDAEQGRYTNSSIVKWLDKSADGLIYGVQIPKYSANQTTEALKTDANAGLVLEASTNTRAGRNDYEGRKLFACPRVNGGVDKNGMPYVTAIEGIDSRFDSTAANTWALTPIYYVKHTETNEYYLNQYTDSPHDGFEACFGAFTDTHAPRPFILRACYMDSGSFNSVSGSVPASATAEGVEGYSAAIGTASRLWEADVARGGTDGLTHLTAADVAYQLEFMQLMLGVKAPKAAAQGCLDLEARTTTTQDSEAGCIVVDKAFADKLPLGCCLSLGAIPADGSYQAASRYSKGAFVVVEAVEDIDDANTKISISGDVNAISAGVGVGTLWWRNGSCDNVLGTFGVPYEEGLTDGKVPFRFQNCETMLGLEELVSNVYSQTGSMVIASSIPLGTGDITWSTVPENFRDSGSHTPYYIADYAFGGSLCMPRPAGGSSTTGYCVEYRPEGWSYNRGYNPLAISGSFADGADIAGIGSVRADIRIAMSFGPLTGSRISAIGRSEVV